MVQLRILAVDDDPVTLALLSKHLAHQGYRIDTERDSRRALERLERFPYDVIITDLMMPGNLDGIEVLRAVKATRPGTEVLLLTGHASVQNAVEAMKQGAFDYLQKPVNFDELYLLLERIGSLKRLCKNSDDLREAMEITERSASETIACLEMEAARLRGVLEKIGHCLMQENTSTDEKVKHVGALIESAEVLQ